MKSLRYLFLLLTIVFSISACKKSDVKPEVTLDVNLVNSPAKYSQLIGQRANSDNTFNIEDIKRNGDVLAITVKGGCTADDFKIVWDGKIFFSYPGQINLVLYSDSDENCGVDTERVINVNLSKILGQHDPKDFIFNVANGSKRQDASLSQNGSVTSK